VNSGAISELPVSDSVCEMDAGVVGAAAPATEDAVPAGADPGGVLAPQAARARAAAEVNAIPASARLPARPSKGGCACSASNDNLPSLVLDPNADGQALPVHAH